ncbi:hypothetical protein [Mycolicibacterium sp. YH-1]|uniref:hypothetical protein n=1 Tax=Mycolicibacterium sp. YH-1 TaxID=2908837 RepID=UPI001F4BF0D2|nr:hypothetical protein [Mycolicibacterium sp. YH-1]UNB52657.1 hypothetical protein L0M16_33285 [Mycolicibacterium sp. YH-1]
MSLEQSGGRRHEGDSHHPALSVDVIYVQQWPDIPSFFQPGEDGSPFCGVSLVILTISTAEITAPRHGTSP